MLTHNFTYESALNDSLKVNWRVEDIIGGDRKLDFTKPFLPEALARVQGIECLSAAEKLKLNQIRGNSYLHLFGLVEEFILPLALDQARRVTHEGNASVRALVRFAEEEAKHMELFRRFSAEFAAGFGTPCGGIGPSKDIAQAVLNHGALGVVLVTLHLEWMTQAHYLESVKDDGDVDPQFKNLLRFHWMEEAQHAKIDTMLTDDLARAGGPEVIARGFEDYASIGSMLDGGLAAQQKLDLESLEKAIGRTLSDAEKAEITSVQVRSYRHVFLVSGMIHPNFVKACNELAPPAAAKIAEMARALS